MFDDSGFGSGFGGDSFFDSNHDGHLNAFERDHAECFLHDCDTYDQVMKKEGYCGSHTSRMDRENAYYISVIKWQLKAIAVLAIINFLLDFILGLFD